jgi:hypothetical protein
LICLLGLLNFGCSDNSISGEYSGRSITKILGGNTSGRSVVVMSAMITQKNNNISVQLQSCNVSFEIYDTGLANFVKGSSCTIDPEVDGGTNFIIKKGQALFGDDAFGMELHGVSSDKSTWDFIFSGIRK